MHIEIVHDQRAANEKYLIFSLLWHTRQKIVAGSDEEQNLPGCQSTICIVML